MLRCQSCKEQRAGSSMTQNLVGSAYAEDHVDCQEIVCIQCPPTDQTGLQN